MPREKKVFSFYGVELSLYAPEDLSKKWYLEWYDGKKRCKKYGTINQVDTVGGRLQRAEILAKQLSADLISLKSVSARLLQDHVQTIQGVHAKSTFVNIKGQVNKFIAFLGNREINRQTVEAFFDHLAKTRHPTTYNQYRIWLTRMLSEIDMPGLTVNIKRKKAEKTPLRYFQAHQAKRLAAIIENEDPELWLYVKFVYYCFIRPGRELPHLKAGNIMMEDREIFVTGAHSKNDKTQYVAIPDAFFPDLTFVYDMAPGEYLFPGHYDKRKPVGRNTMYERHKCFLERLGFGSGYSLYSWKHTGAVRAVKAGIGVKELQLQLRHSSLSQTDQYLRQMGIRDVVQLRSSFPGITVAA